VYVILGYVLEEAVNKLSTYHLWQPMQIVMGNFARFGHGNLNNLEGLKSDSIHSG